MTINTAFQSDYLRQLKERLPPIIDSGQLKKLGIVRSLATLGEWRAKGEGPPWYRVADRRIVYVRDQVFDWLESKFQLPAPEIDGGHS